MTTPLDRKLVPAALKLLAKYGVAATFTVYAEVANESTGTVTRTPTVYTGIKVSPPSRMRRMSGGVTQQTESLSIVFAASGLAFTPAIGMDVAVLGNPTYRCTEVNTISSGDSVAIYEVFLGA